MAGLLIASMCFSGVEAHGSDHAGNPGGGWYDAWLERTTQPRIVCGEDIPEIPDVQDFSDGLEGAAGLTEPWYVRTSWDGLGTEEEAGYWIDEEGFICRIDMAARDWPPAEGVTEAADLSPFLNIEVGFWIGDFYFGKDHPLPDGVVVPKGTVLTCRIDWDTKDLPVDRFVGGERLEAELFRIPDLTISNRVYGMEIDGHYLGKVYLFYDVDTGAYKVRLVFTEGVKAMDLHSMEGRIRLEAALNCPESLDGITIQQVFAGGMRVTTEFEADANPMTATSAVGTMRMADGLTGEGQASPMTAGEASGNEASPMMAGEASGNQASPMTASEANASRASPMTAGEANASRASPMTAGEASGSEASPMTADEASGNEASQKTAGEANASRASPMTASEASREASPMTAGEVSVNQASPMTAREENASRASPMTAREASASRASPMAAGEPDVSQAPLMTASEASGSRASPMTAGEASGSRASPMTAGEANKGQAPPMATSGLYAGQASPTVASAAGASRAPSRVPVGIGEGAGPPWITPKETVPGQVPKLDGSAPILSLEELLRRIRLPYRMMEEPVPLGIMYKSNGLEAHQATEGVPTEGMPRTGQPPVGLWWICFVGASLGLLSMLHPKRRCSHGLVAGDDQPGLDFQDFPVGMAPADVRRDSG